MTLRPCRSSVPASFVVFGLLALAPASAGAATIRGTVTDPDGRSVPGARVVVLQQAVVVTTTGTDQRGSFVVSNLPSGEYDVRVVLEGFRSEPARLRLAADDDRDVALRLQLSAIAESVVVSAAHAELPLSRVPASVTVLTDEALRAQQVTTVADALRLVPGLTVQRSGGQGAITSLFPRGGESDYTLVLVDGVPMNSFGGGFDFAHLPAVGIERVEVVRGPQSAVYGGGAIGAIVQVVTANGGPSRLAATVEGGTLGTSRLTLSSAGSRGHWGWGLSGEHRATDGYTGAAPASGERVSNDDYRSDFVTIGGRWSGPRRAEVRGDVRLDENERGFPGPFGSDPASLFPGVDRISRGTNRSHTVAASATFDWSARVRPLVQVTYAAFEGDFKSPYGLSRSATARLTARAQADVRTTANIGVSVGIDFLQERGESTFITDSAFDPIPVRRNLVGPFAEARYERASRLFVVGGLRVERIHRDALAEDIGSFAPRPALAPDTRIAPTPRLSASYYLQPVAARARGWTKLHASAAAGIRPPDAFEIAFTDNPSLRPERSRSVDAGIEQAMHGGRVVFDATVFANRYDDLIVAVGRAFQDASRYRTDNISNARARGLELSAELRSGFGLDASVAYTFLATEILAVDGVPGQAPPPFTPGDPLVRRPRHQASVDLTLRRSRVTAFARVGGRGRMLDVEPNLGAFAGLYPAPGYVVADAGASVRVAAGVELYGRVSNVLDRRYEENLGFPAPPRTAIAGVRVAVGH